MIVFVDQEGDGWMASEGTCRNCGSPRRMPRTELSGNQEFGPLTPPGGKRRSRRRYSTIMPYKGMGGIELRPLQLMRVDYIETLLYREDNSFVRSRHCPGGH